MTRPDRTAPADVTTLRVHLATLETQRAGVLDELHGLVTRTRSVADARTLLMTLDDEIRTARLAAGRAERIASAYAINEDVGRLAEQYEALHDRAREVAVEDPESLVVAREMQAVQLEIDQRTEEVRQ